jgi:hypothetical protein
MPNADSEVRTPLYELPAGIQALDAARGTILVMDWRVFRELGIYDPYLAAADAHARDALTSVTAGSWVPIELLRVHYEALDALNLDDKSIRQIGQLVGDGVHGAVLSTLTKLAGACGVSPWLALRQTHKLWARSWRGGGVSVHRIEEQIADVTVLESAVCASRFFRESFAGVLCAGVARFGHPTSAFELTREISDLDLVSNNVEALSADPIRERPDAVHR